MDHGTQVRCRDCATGWVTISSEEDVPSASHRICEACHTRKNSHRAEKRAQGPKPRGRPPKKSNRGQEPQGNIREWFGNPLRVIAPADEGGNKDANADDDDDGGAEL